MRTIVIRLLLFVLLTTSFLFVPQNTATVSAACGRDSVLGVPTWHKYLEDGEPVAGKCTPRIRGEDPDNPGQTVDIILPIGLAVLEIAATLGAIVALIMVFWGAFNFVLTQGESEKAAGARRTVINAAIGLVILMVSTQVVSFFGRTLS